MQQKHTTKFIFQRLFSSYFHEKNDCSDVVIIFVLHTFFYFCKPYMIFRLTRTGKLELISKGGLTYLYVVISWYGFRVFCDKFVRSAWESEPIREGKYLK